jgi:hypothetical protein
MVHATAQADLEGSQHERGSALKLLERALGRGVTGDSGDFRWRLIRSSTGTEVRVELEPLGAHTPQELVWVFDPDGRGLSGAYSFEVSSPEGLAYLEAELRRLLGHDY